MGTSNIRPRVVDTDQILVLEAGRVVEHGRHHQLLARSGHHAQMWERQQAAPAA
jgi:ATP-binding cassette, subfamily B, heavy metal transporter